MKNYTHLSHDERVLISHYHESGISLGAIAHRLRRSKSTISRELRRNSNLSTYVHSTAFKRYLSRRSRPRRLDTFPELGTFVIQRLQEGISPEMIALRLRHYAHVEGLVSISHESIYQWLYRPQQKKQKLYKLLVQHHAKRGRRKRVYRTSIKDKVSIHERPASVMDRQEVGHWEADLMAFKGNKQHLLVLHERKTRYTAAVKLSAKTAQETLEAMLALLSSLPKNLLKSITFDNGSEFAYHRKLGAELKIPTYFCDVYASWQKGGIENANGRIRWDLPRSTDLLALSDEELQQIMINQNLMPRKVLHGKNAFEELAKHLGHHIIFSFNRGVALRL